MIIYQHGCIDRINYGLVVERPAKTNDLAPVVILETNGRPDCFYQ